MTRIVFAVQDDGSHIHYREGTALVCRIKHSKPLKFLEKVALVEGGIITVGAGVFVLLVWLLTK